MSKYYVVWKGRKTGIYSSWEACKEQTDGFPKPVFKAFKTLAEAEKAFAEGTPKTDWKKIYDKPAFQPAEKKILDSLAVDAACSGNPGVMEYRGVYTKTREEVFRKGPFPQGTNNIGEFLALVHGLALLKQQNNNMPVFSDSQIAIGWVLNKKCKTKLEENELNTELFLLVNRAEKWLQQNTYNNKILKWDTKKWGEIPADFGRK